MIVRCPDCKKTFDDAECWTVCPHNPLMPREDLDRKNLAISLLGRNLYWAGSFSGPVVGHPAGSRGLPAEMQEPLTVESISWNGMVTLRGWIGEFAPHLFVVKEGA